MVLDMDFTEGITIQAMQTGGIGVLLTLLILTTPPMAAFFFQGTWVASWRIRRLAVRLRLVDLLVRSDRRRVLIRRLQHLAQLIALKT
ncbi:hypothetical protein [Xanthomonas cannabis]|uniref:hypothetical protein n=1 Tax=Xanthomonas cannabis TaxID=1885674 RepID=UPI0033A0456C